MTYIQDPNDETKVIDTSFTPPSIDPIKLSEELDNLRQTRQEIIDLHNENIAGVDKEIDFKQKKLEAIYVQVPEVLSANLEMYVERRD